MNDDDDNKDLAHEMDMRELRKQQLLLDCDPADCEVYLSEPMDDYWPTPIEDYVF